MHFHSFMSGFKPQIFYLISNVSLGVTARTSDFKGNYDSLFNRRLNSIFDGALAL